jgi:hypothetical protein
MHANVGDRLFVEGDPARTALIVGVPHDDGSPPYVVKWLTDGHVAMVSPGQFARVIPAGTVRTAGEEGVCENSSPASTRRPGGAHQNSR